MDTIGFTLSYTQRPNWSDWIFRQAFFQTKVSSGAHGPRKAGRVQVPSLDPWLGRGHNDEKRVGRAPGVDGEERQVLG